MPDTTAAARRIPALDGLRVVAVLIVFGFHASTKYLLGGSIGVDIFFVLSGFVITSLLYREWTATGRVDFSRFYVLRLARLWPALILVSAAVLLASFALGPQFLGTYGHAAPLLAVTYTMNIARALVPSSGPLGHTWSLGIEEQYYLLWPLVLVGLLRILRPAHAVAAVAGLALVPVVLRFLLWDDGAGLARVYNMLDTRADGLLVGSALAIALTLPMGEVIARLARWLLWPAVLGLAAIALFEPVRSSTGARAEIENTWGFLVVSALTAIVIAGLVSNRGGILSTILSLKWLAECGRRYSYGFYLWHYPVIAVLRPIEGAGVRAVVSFAVTAAIAVLSAHFVEDPVRRWSHRRFDRRGPSA